ncbi:hypothetical protein PUN4_10113 [Paraburkholderia unamae]|nr:hypothetical protein PUN4_10113 [Paraburkholderia unamae]
MEPQRFPTAPDMFRALFQHGDRLRARALPPRPGRTTLRIGAFAGAAVTVLLAALAVAYAPASARANLARCVASLADDPAANTKNAEIKPHQLTSRAIERCLD